MRHKWGQPDMLLGRAYRFCEVCGATQYAKHAMTTITLSPTSAGNSYGRADYMRFNLRWVYEDDWTAECPGEPEQEAHA